MPLTNNETTWAVMIIPLVISLGWGTLLTWITIRAQHAKSIDEIKDDTKKIFVRLFLWISNLSAVSMLVWEYSLSPQINRKDVFLIVWSVSLLFMSLILYVVNLMKEMTSAQKEHLETTRQISKNLNQVVDTLIETNKND